MKTGNSVTLNFYNLGNINAVQCSAICVCFSHKLIIFRSVLALGKTQSTFQLLLQHSINLHEGKTEFEFYEQQDVQQTKSRI